LINLESEVAKSYYHRQYILTSARLEYYGTRLIAPILGRCFLDSARLLEFGITNFDNVVTNIKPRLREALIRLYDKTGVIFSNWAFDAFEDVFGKTYAEVPLTRGMREDYGASYGVWAKKVAARKVVKIDNVTRESIRYILEKGKAGGKSYRMIATDMRNISPSVNQHRAYKIARTEIHTASIKATDDSLRHTRVQFEREWRSIIDARIRGLGIKDIFNHIIANGERVGQDAKFIRTGEALDYPGDPDGSAGNIINCRCALLYHALRRVTRPVSKTKPIRAKLPRRAHMSDKKIEKTLPSDVVKKDFEKAGIKKTNDEIIGIVNSLVQYTSGDYQKIRYARKHTSKEFEDKFGVSNLTYRRFKSMGNKVNEWIKIAPKFTKGKNLYRGLRSKGYKKFKYLMKDDMFDFSGLSSLTSNKKMMMGSFLGGFPDDAVAITIKGGTEKGASVKFISKFYEDDEVIIPDNVKFKIISKKEKSLVGKMTRNILEIVCEEIE